MSVIASAIDPRASAFQANAAAAGAMGAPAAAGLGGSIALGSGW